MSRGEKILVFLLGSLGDTIVAIPALRVIRANFPDAEIVVLHESGLGLVEPPDVLPAELVDRFLSYKRGRTAALPLLALVPLLRRERFDASVYLVFSERPSRSVERDRRFFRAAGIHSLIGFRPFSSEELYPIDEGGLPTRVPSEAERKVSRLAMDGLECSKATFDLPWIRPADEVIDRMQAWQQKYLGHGPILAVAPGCKTKANQWVVENFIELVRLVREQIGAPIVIVGGPNEFDAGEMICQEIEACANAAGKFSVREMAALLASCDGYIGLDTGTTHLAAAVGIPVVAIYGQRNNPGHWFPYATSLEIIENKVRCAGCREQVCPVAGHPCMTGIAPSDVASAVRMLRAGSADKTLIASEVL